VASDYGVIRADLLQLYGTISAQRPVAIYAIHTPVAEAHPRNELLGRITLARGKGPHLDFATRTTYPEQDRLQEIVTRAGAMLPRRLRDSIEDLHPTTPFASWMALVWKHSILKPRVLHEVEVDALEGSPPKTTTGIQWVDPIGSGTLSNNRQTRPPRGWLRARDKIDAPLHSQ
jgi:hypothetical protein